MPWDSFPIGVRVWFARITVLSFYFLSGLFLPGRYPVECLARLFPRSKALSQDGIAFQRSGLVAYVEYQATGHSSVSRPQA